MQTPAPKTQWLCLDLKATFSLFCAQWWQLSADRLQPQLPRSIRCDHWPSGYFSPVFNFNNYRQKRPLKKDNPGHWIHSMSSAIPRKQFTTQWKMILFCMAIYREEKSLNHSPKDLMLLGRRASLSRWREDSADTELLWKACLYLTIHDLVCDPRQCGLLAKKICLL